MAGNITGWNHIFQTKQLAIQYLEEQNPSGELTTRSENDTFQKERAKDGTHIVVRYYDNDYKIRTLTGIYHFNRLVNTGRTITVASGVILYIFEIFFDLEIIGLDDNTDYSEIISQMQETITILQEKIVELEGVVDNCCGDDTEDVVCMPDSGWTTGNTPENMFFTIYALSDGNVQINRAGTGRPLDIKYKKGVEDVGWHDLPDEYGTQTIPVTNGEIVEFFSGTVNTLGPENYVNFTGTDCEFAVYGNITSFYCGDDWDNSEDGNDAYFKGLFKNCTTLKCAKYFILPGLDLEKEGCYEEMFMGCTNMVYVPEKLPATWGNRCMYKNMFRGCTSLTDAPEIMLEGYVPEEACYGMFYGCTSLVNVYDFHTIDDEIGGYGLADMFSDCTSLVKGPEIPLGDNSFVAHHGLNNMFYNCTNLVSGPSVLNFESLGDNGCGDMFSMCKSLTKAPELPGTDLAEDCYASMFYGCSSLVDAPALPCEDTYYGCYNSMFAECTSLVNAPDLLAETVEEGAYSHMFENCKSLLNTPRLGFTRVNTRGCEYMFVGCESLLGIQNLPLNTGDDPCYLDEAAYSHMFEGCKSLVNIPVLDIDTIDALCEYMFAGCTSLVNAPGSIYQSGNWNMCDHMFAGCTSLTIVPELPGDSLETACYRAMFSGCTSLVNAPELPATDDLANECYAYMFDGCSSLGHVKCLATYLNYNDCTKNWLRNVSTLGVFEKNEEMDDWESGPDGIPTWWTIHNA